jgi:hypothetical protein
MPLTNNNFRSSAAIALAIAAAMSSTGVQAAKQGGLGATSTGLIEINASVPNRARISGLSDIDFTGQDPETDASNAQNVCVWSNTASKGYTITASGSGEGEAFTLSSDKLTVPYRVQWSEAPDESKGEELTATKSSPNFVSKASHQVCKSDPPASASLIVGISSDDLGGMQAETNYTGTLTLVVTPQ